MQAPADAGAFWGRSAAGRRNLLSALAATAMTGARPVEAGHAMDQYSHRALLENVA